MSFKKLKYGLVTAAFILIAGCSNTDCYLSNVVRSEYTFVNSLTNKETTITEVLTVTALPSDTTLLNHSTNISKMSLPMGYANTVDSLLFNFDTAEGRVIDTVCIEHTNIPHFESLDCGTSVFHIVKNVSFSKRKPTEAFPTVIDSIVIINPKVTYDATENFKIYISTH